MIFLHIDSDAQARVHRVASQADGDVLGCDLKAAGLLDPEIIAKGIAGAADPKLIVVLNAKANNREERRAFEGLRRIAKFRGLDVHIAGDRSVEHIADQIVQSDADLTLDAPGSSVGEQITTLIRARR